MDNENFNVEFGEVVNIGGGTSDFNQLSNRPKYNNTPMTGATNIPKVPTKTSELNNDSDYQTGTEVESAISTAIAGKQDTLTAGNNITISNNTISATDTTYSAGTGLTLDGTQFSVNTETIATQQDVSNEATARENADTNLQGQIDAISASSDVTDIVGTYADLQAYDTTHLKDNDIIKVLQDESQNGETTYYRWSTSTQTFTLIGEEGPYYTKSQTDTLLQAKQDTLTAGSNITIASDNTISATDTTYSAFTGTDGTAAGTAGLVPAPATTDAGKVLGANGSWVTGGPNVVQSTGTSTTDVMSQNATTRMVYDDPNAQTRIKIGGSTIIGSDQNTVVGYGSGANGAKAVAIGANNWASGSFGIALGAGAAATQQGQFDVSTGASYPTRGYNNSTYRLLTGLYDGQNAHDAATKGQLDSAVTGIESELDSKQDVLTAGQNIHITDESGNLVISADSTTYTAGEAIDITNSVISATNTGKARELTTADYNFPTNSPDGVALWKLPYGSYTWAQGVKIYSDSGATYGERRSFCNYSNYATVMPYFGGSGTVTIYVYGYYNINMLHRFIMRLDVNTDAGSASGDIDFPLAEASVIDNLTTQARYLPLSANQGRTLNNRIGNLSTLTTTAKTSAVAAINELDTALDGKQNTLTAGQGISIADESGDLVISATSTGPTVVQTTGTSTTDVMSQNATTSMVFADPSSKQKVQIGNGSNAVGDYALAIGRSAQVNNANGSVALGFNANVDSAHYWSVALGANSSTTSNGEVSFGGPGVSGLGYNNSNYRLLTNVYDGQSAHDAATVAQGNTLSTSAPTTSTVGVLGQLYTDTTNMHTYQCTAISGDTYTWTQRW